MQFIPSNIIGLAWYTKENYAKVVSISKDGHVFARRYEDWLAAAEKQISRFEAQGFTVVKAEIDPETFPAWCAAHGVDVDAKGRTMFGSWKAEEFRRSKQGGN